MREDARKRGVSEGSVCLEEWQGQQGSNPRPTVLETVALPAELYPFIDARKNYEQKMPYYREVF